MARGSGSTKRRKLIGKVQKQCMINDERNKCDCNHSDHHEMDITPKKNRKPGELLYTCNQCLKDLHLNIVEEDDQRQSCNILDTMCDVIKMNLDPEKEKEAEVAKTVASVQFFVRNNAMKLYAASLKKNQNGGRNNRRGKGRRDNNYDSSWTPADVGGRYR